MLVKLTKPSTKMWQTYKQALTRHPLLVKAATAATLMSLSDVLVQTYEQAKWRQTKDTADQDVQGTAKLHDASPRLLSYNWNRTLHVGMTGLTFSGPISHAWYGLLEDTMVGRLALSTATSCMTTKLVLDAILFSPVAVAGYFVWRSVLEGSDVRGKLEHQWMPALQASWSFWPLVNIVNFGMVPLPYRVLYNNGLSLVWNAYLSSANDRRVELGEKAATEGTAK